MLDTVRINYSEAKKWLLLSIVVIAIIFVPAKAVENLDFNWSMKERFGELNEDGTINYHYDPCTETYDQSYVYPQYYFVDVDACAVTGNTQHYNWVIDDESTYEAWTCKTTLWFNKLGKHNVTLIVWDENDPNVPVSITKTIELKDWLIVSIGESYASGEGNPDIEGMCNILDYCLPGEKYKWQDQRCHRSAYAGAAQAAMELEKVDPHSSVTFVSFACSGATISEGIIGGYEGAQEPLCQNQEKLPPQTFQIAKMLCPSANPADPICKSDNARSVDILLVSIGGNDVGFRDIVVNCAIPFTDCSTDLDLWNKVSNALGTLNEPNGGLYAQMNADIEKRFKVDRIFITEYPDPTTDHNGDYCNNFWRVDIFPPPLGGEISDFFMIGVTAKESEWAQKTVLKSLNDAVKQGANSNGWTYIGGIADGFYRHGYCSNEAWFRRLFESYYYQGNERGTMHPTKEGHKNVYSQKMLEVLKPIVLNKHPLADAGGPYHYNEGEGFYIDGSSSTDPDNNIVYYRWDLDDDGDFDDGYGEKLYVTWYDDYSGNIHLNVTDYYGASDTDTTMLTISNVAPTVNSGDDQTVNEGENVTFSGSYTDPGFYDTHQFSWNFGDGSNPSNTLNTTHKYGDNGSYSVTLTVTDDDGGVGSDSLLITVKNQPPTISPISIAQPNQYFILPGVHKILLEGEFIDPGWLDTHTGEWNFGDGTVISADIKEEHQEPDATGSATANHTYNSPGDFTVILTILDDDSGSDSNSILVHVADAGEVQDIINTYIQNLPDSAFKGKANQNKKAFANMFAALDDMLADEEYNGMIQNLQNNIRSKADGSIGGKPGDDWIRSPDAQREICRMIDDLIRYLKTFL